MASNIVPTDEAKSRYNKEIKPDSKSGFGFFSVEGENRVECVDLIGADKKTPEAWAEVVSTITTKYAQKPVYIVGNYSFTSEGRDQKKLIFVSWCPEDKIKVKAKMLHGASLQGFKASMDGLQYNAIAATNAAEIGREAIEKAVIGAK